jgi:hypothetical protein
MLYSIVESFSPLSGDAWDKYCNWRGLRFERFDSIDGLLRPSLFDPKTPIFTSCSISTKMNASAPVDLMPVPSGLSAYLLLIPVGRRNVMQRLDCRSPKASARGQEPRQKQLAIPDWGR